MSKSSDSAANFFDRGKHRDSTISSSSPRGGDRLSLPPTQSLPDLLETSEDAAEVRKIAKDRIQKLERKLVDVKRENERLKREASQRSLQHAIVACERKKKKNRSNKWWRMLKITVKKCFCIETDLNPLSPRTKALLRQEAAERKNHSE
ncbi:hypothetical protein BT69DRAFT_1298752 [Atractiella rhizophila]|nr:hypothetical protein BT69DRAFT_1298752 [Atractiella rhizophila]